jgi:hypothetical protein
MRVLLICPFTQSICDFELETPDFLKSVRRMIGAQQLDSALCGPDLALWFDNFGLLEPGQSYWRLHPAAPRIAGRAIITAVSPQGFPTDLPETVPMETLEASMDWCKVDDLIGIDERIVPMQTEFGIWPRIVRHPRRWRETPLH